MTEDESKETKKSEEETGDVDEPEGKSEDEGGDVDEPEGKSEEETGDVDWSEDDTEDDAADESEGDTEDDAADESEDDTEDDADDSEAEGETSETEQDEPSSWDEKMKLAVQLWEAGNNARLQEVLDELEKAPKEDKAVHTLVAEYRNRLKPDPVAIGLWVLTLCVFCILTYIFVIR